MCVKIIGHPLNSGRIYEAFKTKFTLDSLED